MARGDHFFVWRQHRAVPFQHHGIDAGDGTAIHFTDGDRGIAGPGTASDQMVIRRTPIDWVTRDGRDPLHIVEHRRRLSGDETVQRGISQIGRRGYHLLFENCEHFACWCVVGQDQSHQVDVACERISSLGVKATFRIAAKCAGTRVIRGANPWMYMADAAQWLTEAGGHHVGLRDPKRRKRASRAVGATVAIGVGAASGPIGIGIAGGLWAAGQFGGELSKAAYGRLRRQGMFGFTPTTAPTSQT
jgi:hypothetical protein